MNQRNIDVKNYLCEYFSKEDEDLLAVKESALKSGLPHISIPENVGKLIYLLTKIHQPKTILEVGTLAGYSTVWMAKAAPKAKIFTIECDPKRAAIARANFQCLKMDDRINVIEQDAHVALKAMIKEKTEPFDLIFLDADKESYPAYLPLLLKLSKAGTLLLTDNLIPKSEINHPKPSEEEAVKIYEYNSILASYPNIETTLATTIVGDQGRIDALGVSLINRLPDSFLV